MQNTRSHFVPLVLALLITATIAWSGISPVDRTVWYAEILPAVLIFMAFVVGFFKFQFSAAAYLLAAVWLILHTIGAKYTFANVPFDWANQYLGFLGDNRNHFDRVAHFSIGFYAFAMAEWLLRTHKCRFGVAWFFSLFFIMAVAAAYEIIEWQYAVIEGGDAGVEFLGSQGDIWDAQKDMLADTLGALVSLLIFAVLRPDLRR